MWVKDRNLLTGHHVGRARRWRRERTLLAALWTAAGSAVAALSVVFDAEEACAQTTAGISEFRDCRCRSASTGVNQTR